MTERLATAPFAFWIHLVLLVFLVIEGLRKWDSPWAKPALVVYGTVLFWYTGDYLASSRLDYAGFAPETISFSFLQVAGFLVVFRIVVPKFSKRLCEVPLRFQKNAQDRGIKLQLGQVSSRVLRNLLMMVSVAWLIIFFIGVSLSEGPWKALIWPPVHYEKVQMYPLVGVGGKSSFIFNSVGYVHMLVCALFGVIAILAKGPVRWIALVMVFITWPYFWFDRTRSKMLALLLPGLAAFVLLGKGPLVVRLGMVAIVGFGLSSWFGRVMEYRSAGGQISSFIEESNGDLEDEETDSEADARREASRKSSRIGQDMLKELCWVNTLIESDRYSPNWGARYLAELANPIPRAIWPGKPTVGIDYAIARGFGGARTEHGVFATVSTGMIGQGCVNFGPYLGVVAAGLIFGFWAAFLSRLWCQRYSALRLGLFLIGMGLTLNTGRDFTLLVLFPFLFGYIGVRLLEWRQGRGPHGGGVANVVPIRRPNQPEHS